VNDFVNFIVLMTIVFYGIEPMTEV